MLKELVGEQKIVNIQFWPQKDEKQEGDNAF